MAAIGPRGCNRFYSGIFKFTIINALIYIYIYISIYIYMVVVHWSLECQASNCSMTAYPTIMEDF